MIDFDRTLTDEEQKQILAHKIPVTKGWGCGIGGAFMSMFARNPITSIDQHSLMPTAEELKQLRSFDQ